MKSKVVLLSAAVLTLALVGWARPKPQPVPYPQDEQQSWTGLVSCGTCSAEHSEASDEATQCVAKCVSDGGKYVLVSEGNVYQLDPQEKFGDFAGKAVTVTGSMKDGAITVESVEAASTEKTDDDSNP
jgi:Protein of unknown function (DUF5818)